MNSLKIRNLSYRYPSAAGPIFNAINLDFEEGWSAVTGIKDEWLGSWELLSHGERKRLQLAVALSSDSDVLMVDEPTNHLDYKSQAVVVEALRSYKSIGILVSHDRTLLDALTQHTIMIKAGKVLKYRSKFSLAQQAYEQTLAQKSMQQVSNLKGKLPNITFL